MSQILINALRETLIMLVPSCLLSILIGVPLGIISSNKNLYKVSSIALNISSQTPYLLIMLLCIPLTNWIVDHNIKYTFTMIVPLTITGSVLIAQRLNTLFFNLNQKWQHTAKAMGASKQQSLWLILLPESLDDIVKACFDACAVLVGCSAIAGIFGAGGLGQLAVETSVNQPQPLYALASIAILVALQQLIAYTGSLVASQRR